VKVNAAAGKKTRGGGQAVRTVLTPLVHQDTWFLRVVPPPSSGPNSPPNVRWERRKRPAMIPNPARAGATMAFHRGRGVMFGGVHDVEATEEGIDSEFFDQLFVWGIDRNRFYPQSLRKPRKQNANARQAAEKRAGGRQRGKADEEELLRNLAALESGTSLADADKMDIDTGEVEDSSVNLVKEPMMEMPHPRFNAQLAVQNDILYIYGGTFEKGDREFTFDEMWRIDLEKLDGVREIFKRELGDWVDDESSESDEEDEDEDDEEDSEDEDEEMDDGEGESIAIDSKMKDLSVDNARKSRRKAKEIANDESSIAAPIETSTSDLDSNADTEATSSSSLSDGLPHPRPFESLREFFVRTGNEWQDILIAKWSFGARDQPNRSVKEIKKAAFAIAEDKWWDCRDEIRALEDEQDAAGIGEVVSIAERGEGASGGVGRRR
jgi:Domain of unknown function (DUF4110)